MDSKTTLQEIRNKNHFVFKRLFEELYPELVGYANEYLFDVGSSEDVVQEVFVYLWEKSDKIDVKTNLKAYLGTMVRNRCLNILKKIKITDSSKILETWAAFDIDYSSDRFPEDEKQIRYEQALSIIENLPAKMRTVVKLRFIDNYRYNEIADELGVSVNTVKTQLRRAKVKFGELIVSLILVLSILL